MRFLDHIQQFDDVWVARRVDIAQHWAKTHPPVRKPRPSEMEQDTFVGTFGGIYEHSPWVAERAFDLELGPAHDRPAGLANALARAFRRATPDERLAVLRAHPDLAGKLAQAQRLTEDSTSEQASAGLDALTDAERGQFEALLFLLLAKTRSGDPSAPDDLAELMELKPDFRLSWFFGDGAADDPAMAELYEVAQAAGLPLD